MRRGFAILASVAVLSAPAHAVEPDEILADAALEARARAISLDLRCVVCQNESIDASNAGVARDLRLLVRERLVAGDTDAEVFAYVVARYGDFVLFDPPWKPSTYALWLAPATIGLLGLLAVVVVLSRRRGGAASDDLDAEEQAEFDRIMARKGGT